MRSCPPPAERWQACAARRRICRVGHALIGFVRDQRAGRHGHAPKPGVAQICRRQQCILHDRFEGPAAGLFYDQRGQAVSIAAVLILAADRVHEPAARDRLDGAPLIFDVEEDGQVRLYGPVMMTAGNDSTLGPIITFIGTASDQTESGRIRFREGTAATNLRGGYVHYDGAANKLHVGVHDTSDDNLANDSDIITVERASRQAPPGRPRICCTYDVPTNQYDHKAQRVTILMSGR